MAKKQELEIDENFILASIKKNKLTDRESIPQTVPTVTASDDLPMVVEPTPEQPSKEDTRKKRGKPQDYETLFIKEATIAARLGKTVYIRKEYHDRILKIVQVIGGNEVSLFSYIDNVLEHHFAQYQEVITESYNQKNGTIF